MRGGPPAHWPLITRDEDEAVRYGEQPGIDHPTGRQCRCCGAVVLQRTKRRAAGLAKTLALLKESDRD